jgi:hypothetical protein
MHRQMADGFVVETDDTGVIIDQADNHIETGGFSGTVRAQQADYLTASNLHRNRFDDIALAVRFGQFNGFE